MSQDDYRKRITKLEAELARKDRIIADLVKKQLESREHALEQQIRRLEIALAAWMKSALNGKLEVSSKAASAARPAGARHRRRASKRKR